MEATTSEVIREPSREVLLEGVVWCRRLGQEPVRCEDHDPLGSDRLHRIEETLTIRAWEMLDHIERNGLMSSIFTGSKFVARWRVIEARDGGIALDALVRKQDVEESRAEALATALRSEE